MRAALPGISLRTEPGLAAERIGSLAPDSRSVVLSGPLGVDGYQWYELSGPGLPPASGCETPLPTEPLTCPLWHGWAAAGDPATGDAWLVNEPAECPDPAVDMRGFAMIGDYLAIHCYGDSEISFVGWLLLHDQVASPPCTADDVPSRWLWCHEHLAAYPGPNEIAFVNLFVDPASGLTISHDERWVQITGHHDHPAAAGCGDAFPDGTPIRPAMAVRDCRASFVITGITDTAAP